jgi:hypothetical protein
MLSIAAAGVGLLLILDNKDEAIRRARALGTAVKSSGARLFDVATPVLGHREVVNGRLGSRLETPILPRGLESICAHQVATQRLPVRVETLLNACRAAGSEVPQQRFVRFLRAHPSFTETSTGTWGLGSLGLPIVEGTIIP